MNSVEEVQGYIDSNNILSPAEFKRKNILLYSLSQRRGWLKFLVYKNKKKYWSSYNTVEKVSEFLEDNGIKSRQKFQDTFPTLYNRSLRAGFLKELKFDEDILRSNWKDFDTVEKVQKFIDDNNIQSPVVVKRDYPGLYWVMSKKNNWLDLVKFSNKRSNWDHIDTVQKLQEFIDTSLDIETPNDLRVKFPGLYCKITKLGWAGEVVYKSRINNYDGYTIDNVQSVIDSENLVCPTELLGEHRNLYILSQRRGWLSSLKFPKKVKSYMETYFDKLFPVEEYPTFIRNQMPFEWLVSEITGHRLSIDVLISEISVAIEFQGSQHFYVEDHDMFLGSIDSQIMRDKIKYNLLKEHGFEVIYFVDTKRFPEILNRVPEKFEEGGYMGATIITDWEVLKDIILAKLK